MAFQGILRYFRYPSIKLLRLQTYERLLVGLEMEEYDRRSFLCEKGGCLLSRSGAINCHFCMTYDV